jgi:hypothetical protein
MEIHMSFILIVGDVCDLDFEARANTGFIFLDGTHIALLCYLVLGTGCGGADIGPVNFVGGVIQTYGACGFWLDGFDLQSWC